VWFVPGALPGEVVTARALRDATRFFRGSLVEVLTPSPDRVPPPCALADECGGCGLQHADPAAQSRLKYRIVSEQLRALLPHAGIVAPTVMAGRALAYRRRAKLFYENGPGGLRLGFRVAGSHTLVDVPHCPVLEPVLDRALARVRGLASVLPQRGNVLGLTDGTVAVLGLPGVFPTGAVREAAMAALGGELAGIVLRAGRERVVLGRGALACDGTETLPSVMLTPFSFAQAQRAGNEALVAHVREMAAARGRTVLELYCGAGNFTRALAKDARSVLAIDDDRAAIGALRRAAEAWDTPVDARHGNAVHALQRAAEAGRRFDVVVLDPPRSGLGIDASALLRDVVRDRVIYVSCEPATLARDLAAAVGRGLRLTQVAIFDLMPMTAEVEVVAVLEAG
jgi:23S rRNA (uracil1939-C5)-methyltransferase